MAGIEILGFGYAYGEMEVTNHDLEKVMDTSDQWIRSKTGIQSRYFAKEKTNGEMAEEAAKMAFRTAGEKGKSIRPEDVDLLILCTFTPDVATPSTACKVAGKLGMRRDTLCFDLNGACSGFLYGLTVAKEMLESGNYRNALIIGSEKISPYLKYENRNTAALFGDGAGAVLIRRGEKLFATDYGCIPDQEVLRATKEEGILMEGQAVYRFAVETVPESIRWALTNGNVDISEVDYFVLHQANRRIIQSIASKLEQSMDKFYLNIQRYGNTSAASSAICLAEMLEQGLIQEGDTIAASGFGAGLTYCSIVMTI